MRTWSADCSRLAAPARRWTGKIMICQKAYFKSWGDLGNRKMWVASPPSLHPRETGVVVTPIKHHLRTSVHRSHAAENVWEKSLAESRNAGQRGTTSSSAPVCVFGTLLRDAFMLKGNTGRKELHPPDGHHHAPDMISVKKLCSLSTLFTLTDTQHESVTKIRPSLSRAPGATQRTVYVCWAWEFFPAFVSPWPCLSSVVSLKRVNI